MNIMDQLISTRYRLESDGSVTVYREQDVEPILEHNKAVRNEQPAKGPIYVGKRSEGCIVATLPSILIEKWRTEEGLDILAPGGCDMERLRQKLNSRDCDNLRLVRGRI